MENEGDEKLIVIRWRREPSRSKLGWCSSGESTERNPEAGKSTNNGGKE